MTIAAFSRYDYLPQETLDEEYFCVDSVEQCRNASTLRMFELASKSRWTENCTLEDRPVAGNRARARSRVAIKRAGDPVNNRDSNYAMERAANLRTVFAAGYERPGRAQ